MERHNNGYDIIRIIAAFMVVVIHSTVIFLGSNKNNTIWVVAMEINALCLISVPLFFMTSGALLLRKNQILTKQQFKRRFLKQFIPFISWSFVYLVARAALGKTEITIKNILGMAKEPAYYQFWFMYSLLAIYLLLPALEVLIQNCSRKVLEYLLFLWLLFSVIQPTLAAFFPWAAISSHVDLVLCEGYIGYFILGYYLREFGSGISKQKTMIFMIIGIAAVMIPAGAEYVVGGTDYQGYFYHTYLTPGVAMGATAVFLFFQNINWKANRAVKRLSAYTLGIFYIHMLVLTAFEYLGFTGAQNWGMCGVKIIAVFGVSCIIVAIMNKIKWMNKLFLAGR